MSIPLRHSIAFIAVSLLLALNSCNQGDKLPRSSHQKSAQLEQEYLALQKKHQDLRARMTLINTANESLKLRLASDSSHNKDLEKQLLLTQNHLGNLQHEYQSLQTDYIALEATIEPISSRLNASISAHRKELIGIKLGTVVLKDNRQLHQAEVTDINDNAMRLKSEDGWTWIDRSDLPPPIQKRFFYDPTLVSTKALISKTPDTEQADNTTNTAEHTKTLIEAAFAERHRQELAQFRISLQSNISALEKKISTAKQAIKSLKQERKDTAQKFNRSSKIKRSSADKEKAFERIDSKIRKLEFAIQVAEEQIKSWEKELKQSKNDNK